jgi:hypothetical protein
MSMNGSLPTRALLIASGSPGDLVSKQGVLLAEVLS